MGTHHMSFCPLVRESAGFGEVLFHGDCLFLEARSRDPPGDVFD